MRINTRLSPHVQLQYRVPERRSLGTRLTDSYTDALLGIERAGRERGGIKGTVGEGGGRGELELIPVIAFPSTQI